MGMKKVLEGTGASQGIVRGKVRKVRGIEDTDIFQDGEILVTNLTDPSMIVMMAKAAGIITNVGGITSHPAIVSREFGIPCVVATQTATQVLEDGMIVELNGTTGEIYIVEE